MEYERGKRMNLAIIMKYKGEEYALAKSATVQRMEAPKRLVERGLHEIFPGVQCWISTDTVLNGEVAIHPDRDKIMNRLREIALDTGPLPIIEIEAEYERI
jgi:hypothetical protein